MASVSSGPRTVEEIFKDYSARRAGIVRALTYDVDEFYGLCDPEKENLCLYGHPNETWEVNLPAEEVPPELPEPALGINFARDGMNRRDWLSLIAVHSDCWLLSVAFYLGARLNRNERKRLFSLINDLPTVFEVVTERKPVKTSPMLIVEADLVAAQRDQAMVWSKTTQSWQMKVTKKMKTNIVKLYVGAVVEITMQTSSGLVVTSARGGSMGNA
ncbi:UNVERIFIED_CONTAM: PHD finger protein ALFIN-LIKE 2 [Sesamum angustifolium]|uniref:PHD finger protein ALFIN-LIKE n=1 Tax=Sesamum angustifolium TaxID=2727405 RepID=A0AAW2N5I1_9LAMI